MDCQKYVIKIKNERFVAKQYTDDPHPILKGYGFDGLTIGDYREEAQSFVDFLNGIIEKCDKAGIKITR